MFFLSSSLPKSSPALLLVVLAVDAALGVGERCRVTRAMLKVLKAGEEEEEVEVVVGEMLCDGVASVTGEKTPSQSRLLQRRSTPGKVSGSSA